MRRTMLVLALVACGKSRQDKERDEACRSERESATRYLQVAIESFDRIPGASEVEPPLQRREPDKNPDIAFLEAAIDDESVLARRLLEIKKTDLDARKKMRDSAQQTLKHASEDLQRPERDPVAAAKSAQTVFAQLDQLNADNRKQYEALSKDLLALRDRIDAKPPDQIKDTTIRHQLASERETVDLQAQMIDLAHQPVDAFGVQKLALQQVISACSR